MHKNGDLKCADGENLFKNEKAYFATINNSIVPRCALVPETTNNPYIGQLSHALALTIATEYQNHAPIPANLGGQRTMLASHTRLAVFSVCVIRSLLHKPLQIDSKRRRYPGRGRGSRKRFVQFFGAGVAVGRRVLAVRDIGNAICKLCKATIEMGMNLKFWVRVRFEFGFFIYRIGKMFPWLTSVRD